MQIFFSRKLKIELRDRDIKPIEKPVGWLFSCFKKQTNIDFRDCFPVMFECINKRCSRTAIFTVKVAQIW